MVTDGYYPLHHFRKVFLVRRKMDKFLVVIKQIPLDEMVTEERTAAQNEAEVLKMLYHPNIIHHFDSFIADITLNIVMEYAPGMASLLSIPLTKFMRISD